MLPFTNNYLKSPRIDLSGYIGPQLRFQTFYQLELDFDFLRIEVSTDEIEWNIEKSRSGEGEICVSPPTPEIVSIDLSSYEGEQIYLRFRLETDESIEAPDGVYIDNAREILAVYPQLFQTEGVQFRLGNGTSFSAPAPMVSGVAALIWSQRPDLTLAQVRQIHFWIQ